MHQKKENTSAYFDAKADRRAHNRRRTYLGGTVLVGPNTQIPCVIRDLSFSGARLSLSPIHELPQTIELHIDGWSRHFRADIRWQSLDVVGVQFREVIDWRSPVIFAYVVCSNAAERWAASTAFKRYGYFVHEAETVEEAARSILALGPLHPVHRAGRPILFAAIDRPEVHASVALLRAACPTVVLIVASDDSVDHSGTADGVAPRQFTAREVREMLENIVPEIAARPSAEQEGSPACHTETV